MVRWIIVILISSLLGLPEAFSTSFVRRVLSLPSSSKKVVKTQRTRFFKKGNPEIPVVNARTMEAVADIVFGEKPLKVLGQKNSLGSVMIEGKASAKITKPRIFHKKALNPDEPFMAVRRDLPSSAPAGNTNPPTITSGSHSRTTTQSLRNTTNNSRTMNAASAAGGAAGIGVTFDGDITIDLDFNNNLNLRFDEFNRMTDTSHDVDVRSDIDTDIRNIHVDLPGANPTTE